APARCVPSPGVPETLASAPRVHTRGAVGALAERQEPAKVGSTVQNVSQLPAPWQGAPPCHCTLPVPTSPNTVHFLSPGGSGHPSLAPAPLPANPAANGVAAAQYRGAAHTITAPQDRRRARPGVGCARQLWAL
ncbi:hypothetical protein A6R68_15049, partial [Neotoma lepida]